tara:strand:- start:708 stop:1247 length:540 start_codon:yes stop_codon:yes gene_type:complete
MAKADNLLSFEDKEVVYFFSLDCPSCYEKEVYLSAWEKISNQKIIRVPFVQGEQHRGAALLYFVLEESKDNSPLSDFKRKKAAYALASYDGTNFTFEGMFKLLKDKGMVFTTVEFIDWWKSALIMVEQSELVSTKALNENPNGILSTLRVSQGSDSLPVFIEASDAKFMIKALNSEVVR